jgi:hypothetical protein
MNFARILRTASFFSTQVFRTQVFHTLSNKTLATPELVRRHLISRIPFHSPISQVSLYHGKRARHAVKTCFSEKKYIFSLFQDEQVKKGSQDQESLLLLNIGSEARRAPF